VLQKRAKQISVQGSQGPSSIDINPNCLAGIRGLGLSRQETAEGKISGTGNPRGRSLTQETPSIGREHACPLLICHCGIRSRWNGCSMVCRSNLPLNNQGRRNSKRLLEFALEFIACMICVVNPQSISERLTRPAIHRDAVNLGDLGGLWLCQTKSRAATS